MGYVSHSVENLGSPFLSIDETVFVIPKKGVVDLNRSRFKLLFILSGQVEHEIEGIEGRRRLEAGDILIVPTPVRHIYINKNPSKAIPLQTVRLFLDAGYLRDRAKKRMRKPELDLSDYILHHFTQVSQLSGGIDNEITHILTQFREETEQHAIGFQHQVRSLCVNLVVAVARKLRGEIARNEESGGSQTGQLVIAAKEYIFKHLGNDITLGEIAWHLGKSEEHLARVFKRETGKSVFDCVREMRINRAKTSFLSPNMTLTEIAEHCGFNSLSFFSRTFKQCVGMSPREYRKHIEIRLN